MTMYASIAKELTPNDLGLTGTHQAGILIPRKPPFLEFFPHLPPGSRNPRRTLLVQDRTGRQWALVFVYYNNCRFGGTRNEYRLTRLTRFLREASLRPGDTIVLTRFDKQEYGIDYIRRGTVTSRAPSGLRLGGSWRVVPLRR
jgi:hypothetical protein